MTAAFGMRMCEAVRKVLLVTKIGSVSQPILIIIQVGDDPNLDFFLIDFVFFVYVFVTDKLILIISVYVRMRVQGDRGAAGLDGRPGQDGKPGLPGTPGLRVRSLQSMHQLHIQRI